jgi:predicted dehydrogenase
VCIAVAGMGYWGPNLVRVVSELSGAAVGMACDPREDAREALQRRHPDITVVADFDEVLAADEIDAVMLATPIATHHELAAGALRAGKHVFVEKPMAETVEQAEELVALAKANDRVVMPGHTFLYSPPVVKVKELIDSGELGDLHYGSFTRVNAGLLGAKYSVLGDLAAHDFSILHYWLGEPAFVRATGRASGTNVVDVAFVQVGYPDGSLFHLELSWFSPTKLRRTVLVGTRRTVLYEDMATDQLRIYENGPALKPPQSFGEHHLVHRSGDMIAPLLEPEEPLRVEVRDFVDAIVEGRRPRSDMDLGVAVMRMVEAALTSLRFNGAPVSLNAGPAERRRIPDRRLNGLDHALKQVAG